MANPFGEIVDNEKLDEIPRYVGRPKTQEDRAREAMNLINDKGKESTARTYVQELKRAYGNGVTTLCMVYNATGETIKYSASKDWYGFIGRTPYPFEICNGQWASFLHVKVTSAASGSVGALVFTGSNRFGSCRDILLAWSSPWSIFYQNKAYCDEGPVGSFNSRWATVENNLYSSRLEYQINRNGLDIEVNTASGTSPIFRAIIKTPFGP